MMIMDNNNINKGQLYKLGLTGLTQNKNQKLYDPDLARDKFDLNNELLNNKYQTREKNPYGGYTDAFDNLVASNRSLASSGKRRILHPVAEAVAVGLSGGLKQAGINQRMETDAKMQKVFDYYKHVNQAATQQKAWYEQQEVYKQQLGVALNPYNNGINDGTITQDNAKDKLSSIANMLANDESGPIKINLVGTDLHTAVVQIGDQPPQLIDTRSLKSQDIQKQENWDKNYKLELQKAKTQAASVAGMNDKRNYDKYYKAYVDQAIDNSPQLKKDVLNDEINIQDLNSLLNEYQNHPEIFNSPWLMQTLKNKDQGAWDLAIKNSPFTSQETKASAGRILKFMNNVHLRRVGTMSANGQRVTIPMLSFIENSLANPSLTQEGAMDALNTDIKNYQKMYQSSVKQLDEYNQTIAMHKQQASKNQPQNNPTQPQPISNQNPSASVQPQPVQSSSGAQTVVRVKDPKDGNIYTVSPEDANILVSRGGIIV